MTAPPREPVAWMICREDGTGEKCFREWEGLHAPGWAYVPLYAAPAPTVAQPAEQPATDDLVQRLRLHSTHDCADGKSAMVEAADLIERQAREIESLRAECGLRQIRGYNEGKAERDALREVVKAADLMRTYEDHGGDSPNCNICAAISAFDAARAKVGP